MHAESRRTYGRGLGFAILPETAVSGESGNDAMACAVPLDGLSASAFSHKARELNCYLIASTYLRESENSRSNAAVLFGRKGGSFGLYRKVHLMVSADGKRTEAGAAPGDANKLNAGRSTINQSAGETCELAWGERVKLQFIRNRF